jgi:hypothetical protein
MRPTLFWVEFRQNLEGSIRCRYNLLSHTVRIVCLLELRGEECIVMHLMIQTFATFMEWSSHWYTENHQPPIVHGN